MVRKMVAADVPAITDIYNYYILESTASFEVEPLTEEQMLVRAMSIAESFPYYVEDIDGEVAGYCYAHPWKDRAAYGRTLETTIYLSPKFLRHGVGRRLMEALIDVCRKRGFKNLIACITAENKASCVFHESLGFKQVSFFEGVGEKFGRVLSVVDFQFKLQV